MVRSDLHAVGPAPVAILAGQEFLDLAEAVEQGRLSGCPGSVLEPEHGCSGLGPVVGGEQVGLVLAGIFRQGGSRGMPTIGQGPACRGKASAVLGVVEEPKCEPVPVRGDAGRHQAKLGDFLAAGIATLGPGSLHGRSTGRLSQHPGRSVFIQARSCVRSTCSARVQRCSPVPTSV